MKSYPAGAGSGPGSGPGRVPGHVAWVGLGSERWAADRATASDVGATLAGAEDRAVLELVGASHDAGIGWVSIQHPAAARTLSSTHRTLAARGIDVLVLATGTRDEPCAPRLERLVEGAGGRGGHGRGDAAARPAPSLRVVLVPEGCGHQGFVDVVHALDERCGRLEQVDEKAISDALPVPDVDLLVVTGGDRRVPDLLLWQIAYSEIVFLETLWPDVGRADLDAALEDYRRRDRRYGGLVASR